MPPLGRKVMQNQLVNERELTLGKISLGRLYDRILLVYHLGQLQNYSSMTRELYGLRWGGVNVVDSR